MIKNWLITGDCHGQVAERLEYIKNSTNYNPEETAVIILGDAGFNFWLNKTDVKNKAKCDAYGYTIYCVRGNHEERPKNIPTYSLRMDKNVDNYVYAEEDYQNIRFFCDGEVYKIGNFRVLVIGGAYSVDKWYRLLRAGVEDKLNPDYDNPKKTGWFPEEQLDETEMSNIETTYCNQNFDFIFSHTCPLSWEPRDLFLSMIDQDSVDKSMEIWMDHLKDTVNWGVWCFGHYHADRIERPHVEQYYYFVENIENIWNRWQEYDKTKRFDEWWLNKSPAMRDILAAKEGE